MENETKHDKGYFKKVWPRDSKLKNHQITGKIALNLPSYIQMFLDTSEIKFEKELNLG